MSRLSGLFDLSMVFFLLSVCFDFSGGADLFGCFGLFGLSGLSGFPDVFFFPSGCLKNKNAKAASGKPSLKVRIFSSQHGTYLTKLFSVPFTKARDLTVHGDVLLQLCRLCSTLCACIHVRRHVRACDMQ